LAVASPTLEFEAAATLGALRLEVELEVRSAECLALAGPSGGGKTSVLRIVAGLLAPERGRVKLGRQVWLDTGTGVAVPPEHRRCGYVFQEYALFPRMRAWQNVAYAMDGLPRAERRRAARDALARFGVDHLADSRPSNLSGGERQRVALARALASRPRALLLDEPLAALDASSRAESARTLTGLLGSIEVPALLVTHDFEQAALLADRVAVLDRGRVIQVGAPVDLASAPASAFVADFTGAVVLRGVASAGRDGLTEVRLDGGGTVLTTDVGEGPVAVTLRPWEITIEPPGSAPVGSAQNRLDASIASLTPLGNRVRVGLVAGTQSLTAELTGGAVRALRLEPGAPAVASWKASATRLVAR
jgi:molybdate transport system ATP-binding protein